MYEFLKDNFFIPLYAITLVVSLLRYNRYYSTSVLKYLPMLIAYTMVSEILGYFIRDFDSFQIVYGEKYQYANYIIFNIYDVVFFLYFYVLYWKNIKHKGYKEIIKYGGVVYIIATVINPFFQNVLIFPQIYASTIGSIVLILTIFLYYHDIRGQKQKKYKLLVWISYGLLVFNLFFPMISILAYYDYTLYKELNLKQFHYLLIVITYACFILGFVLMRPTRSTGDDQ
ncbi:MAG: hypothetical protein WBM98_17900 [Maribacter sp.]|uniref:hypothetical protein n=1 Tax=Maribacter sp. TaxID=1897614 RepID=UPI003C743F10